MSKLSFIVIGITDSRKGHFSKETENIVSSGSVFSGGRRHYEIVWEILPQNHRWIEIKVPLSEVFEAYKEESCEIVVFASGDPLFYGFATTLRREFPDAEIKVFPEFNSLQMLAHAVSLPYHDMITVSATGRPWDALDSTLIHGYAKIGVLTDKTKTPGAIAKRMLEYGYDNYSMIVGENLGNETSQRVVETDLETAANTSWQTPNCVILKQLQPRKKYFGIPENLFTHLDNREKMITKMPIRLLSLSMLDLHNRHTLWDIGFCTGSVSIEAKLQFPHIKVIAFEQREECKAIFEENAHKFGTPGIETIIGNFLEIDTDSLPKPDAVFIGGHGGHLKEMLAKIREDISKDGVIVFNSVSKESLSAFNEGVAEIGMSVVESHEIALDSFNPITIVKAK